MKYYPDQGDPRSADEIKELGAKPWQLKALLINPAYSMWEPTITIDGWNASIVVDSWADFGWKPDGASLVVNYYFQIERDAENCRLCGGTGFAPDAQWVTESWTLRRSPFRPDETEEQSETRKSVEQALGLKFDDNKMPRAESLEDPRIKALVEKYGPPFLDHCRSVMDNGGEWITAITQDEADVLWEKKRLGLIFTEKPTAEQVNLWAREVKGESHDALNACLCCLRRLERMGIDVECPGCTGRGYVYTAPETRLELVLWVIHPRLGSGRWVIVKNIKEEEIKLAVQFLKGCYRSLTKGIWQKAIKWPRLPCILKKKGKK